MTKLPRGIRNNNPGNIVWTKASSWQGLANPPIEQGANARFCVFDDAVYGIRAIAVTLITYQDKRKAADGSPIDTAREIIERWAPPTENNTKEYVKTVRAKLGLDQAEYPNEVDVHRYEDCRALVVAIIEHENGMQPYTDEQIEKGLRLAGVEPERPKSLMASRTMQGQQLTFVGVAGTAALANVQQIAEAAPALRVVADFVKDYPWIVLAGAAIALIGIAYTVYAKRDERRRGIS